MISIAICDDNEITTQEIAKKVEQGSVNYSV